MDRRTDEAIARAAEAYGCRSVAFTYNDPVGERGPEGLQTG
jgi:pyruvate formate lyase activating enzyme